MENKTELKEKKSILTQFEDLDLLDKLCLTVAFTSSIVALLVALKQFNIFDATPYCTWILYESPFVLICQVLVILSMLGMIYILITIAISGKTEPVKNGDK